MIPPKNRLRALKGGAPLPPPSDGICLPDGSLPNGRQPSAGTPEQVTFDMPTMQRVALETVASLAAQGGPDFVTALADLSAWVDDERGGEAELRVGERTTLRAMALMDEMQRRAREIVRDDLRARGMLGDDAPDDESDGN